MKICIILFIICFTQTAVFAFAFPKPQISKSMKNQFVEHTKFDRSLKREAVLSPQIVCSTVVASSSVTVESVKALAKLISTCGIGFWAAKIGLLDKTALSVLSKLVFGLLQPCLLFSNVASTVATSKSLEKTILLPAAAALQILIGFIIGKLLSVLIYGKESTEESRNLQTCTTFGNSGPLPLVFADALLKSHPDRTLLPQSIGYISLYLLGWSPLFWIIAPGILTPSKNGEKTDRSVLLKRIFSPPILGSLFGLLFGAIPFLRNLFVHSNGILNPIFEAVRTIGSGYLPAVLLVLAGSLIPPPVSSETVATGNFKFIINSMIFLL